MSTESSQSARQERTSRSDGRHPTSRLPADRRPPLTHTGSVHAAEPRRVDRSRCGPGQPRREVELRSMYQVQGKGQKAVAMALKELPAGKTPLSEGNTLVAVTTKLVGEQQESRPLLSPSIDDFLSESRCDGPAPRPLNSNTAVVSTALDLVDLSEPGRAGAGAGEPRELMEVRRRRSPLRRRGGSGSPRRRTGTEQTELIQVEVDHATPERVSLDSVSLSSPLDKWDEVNLDADTEEGGGGRRPCERRCSSHHSSSELLWSADFKTEKNNAEVQSLDGFELLCSSQECGVSRQRRRTRSLLTRNQSLEDEFVRAKAAVESDTQFWDKMQAEWEELARRNWLEESEDQRSTPEQGYFFSANNPCRDWPGAFAEGRQKARHGELNAAVLLLEAAVLQDPQDAEAWRLLGTTQAENENEQAAIAALQRCLELRPNNLPALMALAVSFTNCGLQPEACGALRRWIAHNPRYRQLLQGRGSPATPTHAASRQATPAASPTHSLGLQEVLHLFQEAAVLNEECVDPDLQTGLGVLFNLSSDFNKAVEAFTAALSVRPQDYLLWNRLGATLANGRRSQEAVEAYTRALQLQPGFIRSRYNLGISCINLGALREAVGNFLTALNQQRRTRCCSQQQMSANIWAALRVAISMMERPELERAASLGDLDLLTQAFDVGDV